MLQMSDDGRGPCRAIEGGRVYECFFIFFESTFSVNGKNRGNQFREGSGHARLRDLKINEYIWILRNG